MTRRFIAGLRVGVSAGVTAGATLAAWAPPADAQMVNGTVTHGRAEVSQQQTASGTHTEIQTYTKRTKMTWDKHDVLYGDSLNIQQPSRRSAYLAQVMDAEVTRIDGLLTSNGQVWISNPAGVYFGGNAVVDVARLVAGAGSISDRAFLNGAQAFTDLQGEVVNAGQIQADSVSLVGKRVANHGQIVARRGDIVMAAGDDVWIRRHDTHITVHVPDASGEDEASSGEGGGAGTSPEASRPAVENTGTLEAHHSRRPGRARLAAGDFLGLAIRNTGEIHAREIALSAGEGSMVDVAGTLDVSTGNERWAGGRIDVEGDAIFVDDATLDASGGGGGGRVRIGGDFFGGTGGGRGHSVRTARAVVVGEDAEIRADATVKGDGGEIVVWSDELTVSEGTLSARGGEEGGDGGFVETSSKRRLLSDADVDVSALIGDSGTWLLDPINVRIVDGDDMPQLTETASPELTFFDYLPDLDDSSIPEDSFISTDSLVDALVRGGNVVVTTEARFLTLAGVGVGDITVESEIVIEPLVDDGMGNLTGDPVRANEFSRLFLLAANDIHVDAPIRTDNPNLTLSIDLQANNNEDVGGQREDRSQRGIGDVNINADIYTNGGALLAEGVNVTVGAGVTIDASYTGDAPDLAINGGLVELRAFDFTNSDDPSTVTVGGTILSQGGIFQASGDDFMLSSTGSIDTLGTDANDDELQIGRAQLRFNDDVRIEGDVTSQLVDLDAALAGEGSLSLGAVTITGDIVELAAARLDSDSDETGTASIAIDPGASFVGIGENEDNSTAPSEFRFLQDAPVTDAQLPAASQFGPGGVAHVRYGIESQLGNADDALPDMTLQDETKFEGSDLSLVVPDSILVEAMDGSPIVLEPKNLSLTVRDDFEVSAALSQALRPDGTGDDGVLRIQGAAEGRGDLAFEDGVELVANHISLQAGIAAVFNPDGSIAGRSSNVFAANVEDDLSTTENEQRIITITPTTSFEIIQDADLQDDSVPLASQLAGRAGGLAGLDYALRSQGGSITLADASKVAGTDLALTALADIEIDEASPLTVHSADLGSFDSFLVTEELLDRVTIDAGVDPRVLKLRANLGQLSFESERNEGGATVPVQLRVEADYIELIGQTIDVTTGRPIFQADDFTSPERFIFNHATLVGNSVLPTEDNFPNDPNGRGPSELFAIRSTTSIAITQDGEQSDPTIGAQTDRFWQFPIQDDTRVIITGSNVNISRVDGFNLVLGPLDDVWATSATLQAVFAGNLGDLEPIGFGQVDAENVGSVLGFDLDIDFTETAFGTPMDSDGALTIGNFSVDQDASFLRQGGTIPGLPDFDGEVDGDLALQPDTYRLVTRFGTIQVENDVLRNTNLELGTVTAQDGPAIDFENGEYLEVLSLDAQVTGAFVVEQDARIRAIDGGTIALTSDASSDADPGEGNLSFETGVELDADRIELFGGGTGSGSLAVVDARTNAPTFRLPDDGEFVLQMGGEIRNGVVPGSGAVEVDWGQVPDESQFVLPGATDRLALYQLVSRSSNVLLNDPGEVLRARRVQIGAGTAQAPALLVLRADPGPASHVGGVPDPSCDAEAICGNSPDTDLVLIPMDSGVESVELTAAAISLEAPEGEVVVGNRTVLTPANAMDNPVDPRVLITLLGTDPSFAIRQRDAVTVDNATNLPDRLQIVVSPDPIDQSRDVPYLIQALEGVTVGQRLAERVSDTDLVLVAGLPEAELEAAEGSIRGQPPVPGEEEGDPAAVYDRFADLNGDGVVDDLDRDELEALVADFGPQVAINEPGQAFDLTLRTLRIRSEANDGLPIQLGSVTIRTESDQIYEDEVQLVGDAVDPGDDGIEGTADDEVVPTTLSARAGLLDQISPLVTPEGSSIVFLEEVYGGDTGDESLVVEATNRVRFSKDVGVENGLRLGVLTINLQQLIQFEDPPPVPRAEFGTEETGGEIRVAAREIRLNPQDRETDGSPSIFTRAEVPEAATFFRLGGSLTFDVQARDGGAGVFEMGQNEKLSVQGNDLRILAPGGTATIGDLSAIQNIEVDAATIRMRRREGAEVLRANGRIRKDSGVDYVANTIRFHDAGVDHQSRALYRSQVGSGRDAKFGIADPREAPAFMDDFSVVSLQYNILRGEGLELGGGPLAIDGIPDGVSRRELGDTYPDHRPAVPIAVPAAYRVQRPQTLRDVDIDARPLTRAELHAAARGAAILFDLDSVQGTREDPTLEVLEVRLVAEEVEKAVALHDEVFASDGSRAAHVREVLQQAVDDYRRSTGARRVVGFELRRYVYNRPSSQFAAYQELQRLDSLFRHHRRSGLTATEYRVVQRRWLEEILPEGITVQELSEFVHPSRYVRGSDVLDVFGD